MNSDINSMSDGAFHYETMESSPDYEGMAHEATLAYFEFICPKDIRAREYAPMYLSIYKQILKGIQKEV